MTDEQYQELRREVTQLTGALARERQERRQLEYNTCIALWHLALACTALSQVCHEAGITGENMDAVRSQLARITVLAHAGAEKMTDVDKPQLGGR